MNSTLPHLAIVLLTYNRLNYAARALHSVLDNLVYDGRVTVHIADDGTEDQGYRKHLFELALASGIHYVEVTNTHRAGYGANYNLAMGQVHNYADLVLPLEDDWECMRPLEIERYLPAFRAGFNCVRLGYLGFTQRLWGEVVKPEDGLAYLHLSPESDEPHVFAGHPRLETVAYEREVGPWPEKRTPGDTEFTVAHREKARYGVLWPLDLHYGGGTQFSHIGALGWREMIENQKDEALIAWNQDS